MLVRRSGRYLGLGLCVPTGVFGTAYSLRARVSEHERFLSRNEATVAGVLGGCQAHRAILYRDFYGAPSRVTKGALACGDGKPLRHRHGRRVRHSHTVSGRFRVWVGHRCWSLLPQQRRLVEADDGDDVRAGR